MRRTLAAMGIVAAIVVLLDIIVKRLVTAALGPDAEDHALWLIEEAIGLEYVRNSGAAFGLLRGNAELLAVVSVVVAIGFVWLLVVELGPGRWTALSGGLVVGGGVGNLVERFRLGYVTDFFAVGPWPRFNIADSAITIAIVIFAGALLLDGASTDAPAGERIGTEGSRDGRQT